ncbi:uncharacterized protein ACHE_20603A [Aspergillus chevalieri]|uniref:Uncharacterized protein n=1 Tax=Aspergillus chevalieri TaxID=182096 RepID=A0A7R7ZJX5_ASPCH|nr:uncharacterized protein ACHE_20603A [Aspergillus chevalieri]BCR85145.1 hypothetical protein ACHE_20603A [Aspergillus chevalieri]
MAQNFWDNGRPPLGRVFAASGYRSRAATAYQGHVQVSWGLIQMPSNRTGRNTINTEGTRKFNLPDEIIQPAVGLDDDM